MNKKALIQKEKSSILALLAKVDAPMGLGEIEKTLTFCINKKTLQRRIKSLVEEDTVRIKGEKNKTKYYISKDNKEPESPPEEQSEDTLRQKVRTESKSKDKHPIFSSDVMSLLSYLDTPFYAREKSTYQFALVDNYICNQTQYVPEAMRIRLHKAGK